MDAMDIKFSKGEKELLVHKIKLFFSDRLDQQIGGFDAEFLLEFFSTEIGVYFYNRGLYDAQAILSNRMDEIHDAIYKLERPTAFVR
jgi:uncharacterized protein (DUF2164 family)